ncbi:hypothetical protein vBAmePPT11V19_00064 [Alteromonas phage vB_AmeP_PT11-V19]|nr:hypothetical protein vBAmePPT11V19_00064 [Alteromonas phage vB_AmeP_PT11-V19]
MKYSYLTVEAKDKFFESLGCVEGDYVTLKGMRRAYPYRVAYFTTQLQKCGAGELYPSSVGPEINHLKVLTVEVLTINGEENPVSNQLKTIGVTHAY